MAASSIRMVETDSGMLCMRMIRAPFMMHMAAAAMDPAVRSVLGASRVSPMKSLLDTAARLG